MALFDHGRDHGLGHDEGRVQIHVDDLTELGCSHLGHGNSLNDSRIVHQNIDDAHLALNPGNQRIYRVLVGYVTHIAVGLDSFFRISRQPLVHQILIDIIEADCRSCLRISGSDGKADSIGCSRYQSHFSFQ